MAVGRSKNSLTVPVRRLLERSSQAAYSGAQWEDKIKRAQVEAREVLTVYKAKVLHHEDSQAVKHNYPKI